MTEPGSAQPHAGADAGPDAEAARAVAERIRAAVLGCPGIADLSSGAFGEVASYFPGRSVPGVRVDDDQVEIHVVADYGQPLHELSGRVGAALGTLLDGRPLNLVVDDIRVPGETGPPAPPTTEGPSRTKEVFDS